MRPAPRAPLRPGIVAHQRDVIVRDEFRDLEWAADDVGAPPERVGGQLLGGDAGQAMLWQHRGKQVEKLGVDAIEMEREALLVADVDARDRPIAVGRQDSLDLGIDDEPPGKGDIVGGQRLAIRPAQSRAEPIGHVYRAGSAIPFNVAVFQCRYAFHQVGYRLQVGVQPHEARIEHRVQLRCRNLLVEERRKVGRALPVAHHQRAALVARGLRLILRGRRTGAAQ